MHYDYHASMVAESDMQSDEFTDSENVSTTTAQGCLTSYAYLKLKGAYVCILHALWGIFQGDSYNLTSKLD